MEAIAPPGSQHRLVEGFAEVKGPTAPYLRGGQILALALLLLLPAAFPGVREALSTLFFSNHALSRHFLRLRNVLKTVNLKAQNWSRPKPFSLTFDLSTTTAVKGIREALSTCETQYMVGSNLPPKCCLLELPFCQKVGSLFAHVVLLALPRHVISNDPPQLGEFTFSK